MFVIDEDERYWLKRRRRLLQRYPRMSIFKINRLAWGKTVLPGSGPKTKIFIRYERRRRRKIYLARFPETS
jgi:hypothetical protein